MYSNGQFFLFIIYEIFKEQEKKLLLILKKKKNHSILIFASNTCSLFSPSTVGTRLYPPQTKRM